MIFKTNATAEAVQENTGGNYISGSGIYDVTIKFASLDVSKGGAESVNFNLDYNKNSQTIYGPYVTAKDGKPLEIGLRLINNLAVIAGMGNGQEPVIETESHKVGKDNKEQDFQVITDFSDLPVKIRLQEEYSKYNGNISKRMVIKSFYREDGASASEVISGEGIGTQLGKDEAYASNVTYRDELDAGQIEAWKAEKSGKPAPKTAAAATSTPPTGSLFK